MPTGYTADVADGKVTDFATFALHCARAFRATIMQRDDPMSDPPKHRKLSTYYAEAVPKAEAELTRLRALSLAEAQVEMETERADAIRSRTKYRTEKALKRARYEAMLAEVEAWEVPTPDHAELKAFMAKQITESIEFDCGDFEWPDIPEDRTPEEWLRAKIVNAETELRQRHKDLADDEERCATANAWIDALYASLETKEPARV